MAGNNRHLSLLTENLNGLNTPIKRHRIANWIKKQDPTICCSQETHFTEEEKQNAGLGSKGGKKFSKQIDSINRQEYQYSCLTE
jgi:exonuclease III